MTRAETGKRYKIPDALLDKYENWGFCRKDNAAVDAFEYDERDVEHLSTIMTLYDVGFSDSEAAAYMRLLSEGIETQEQRMNLLNRKRDSLLNEIHLKEAQLEKLDYLRHSIKNKTKS